MAFRVLKYIIIDVASENDSMYIVRVDGLKWGVEVTNLYITEVKLIAVCGGVGGVFPSSSDSLGWLCGWRVAGCVRFSVIV